jgi:hypothetical protein
VDGYRNYDKSEFEPISAVADDDADIEVIWNQQHSLVEFTDAKNFKSYDELKRKLDMVLKGAPTGVNADKISESRMEDVPVAEAPAPRATKAPQMKTSSSDEDEDDTLSYFSKLAED